MTERQWAIIQYALLTYQDALRRACGVRWDPAHGNPPTRSEVEEACRALAIQMSGRIE